MPSSSCPSLYQINTRVWLTELSDKLGRRATLDEIPDAELDRLAEQGFDWVWFLSVWLTGPAAQAISRANPEWHREFAERLPDLNDEDIAGSGFAIQKYTVHVGLGGEAALARLRLRLQKRGLKLMLNFVPNQQPRITRGSTSTRNSLSIAVVRGEQASSVSLYSKTYPAPLVFLRP